ncbi:phosphoglucomutase-like protein 5 isoform X1, partial [Daubentonia madagascariensis]
VRNNIEISYTFYSLFPN